MKKLIALIVSCMMFSHTTNLMQLFEENGYSVYTTGGNKLEEETLKKALDNISEEEFTRRLEEGFDGCSLGIKIEKIAPNTDTPPIDYVVRNLLIRAGQRSYNVAKAMHAIKYEGNLRDPAFDVKHPFYVMCEYMSKNANWINDLLESEDLHRIIRSLELSVLSRENYFPNNPTREELRLMIFKDLKRDAEYIFSSEPLKSESLKELIDTIDDPIKKYTETFLICHALACGSGFHEEHMHRANQILEYFGFLENGHYNMEKVVMLMAEVYITRDDTNYQCAEFIYMLLRRLYRDDSYLEATRRALYNVGKKVAIKASLFMINRMRHHHFGYSPSVMEMIESFVR